MLGAVGVSLVLAWMTSAWFLVAVPLGASYAVWLGLSNGETLDALGTWDDAGGGTAGMSR